MCLAAAGRAAELTVTTTANAGAGSLRQAILDANATVEADTIVFDLAPSSTIALIAALPTITRPLTIDASGATDLLVEQPGGEIVRIDAATTFTDLDVGVGDVPLLLDRRLTVLTNRSTGIQANLSGDGALTKQGPSSLTLSGANTYTGGTLVEAGTLIGRTGSLQGEIELAADTTLRFLQASDGTFSGEIRGAGKVEKVDLGEVALGGTNSWEGGTTINGGALVATTPGAIPGTIVLGANGDLVLDFAADGAFAGNVSGAGGLEKRGTTAVTLTGTHAYTGGTTITDGQLIGRATAFPGDVAVMTPGELVLDQPSSTTGTLAGVVSGDGALVKRGPGTARLTGANSYSGGTTVEAGTLSVTTGSLPGNAAVAGGTLRFEQSDDGSYGGVISGPGKFEKLGSGTLTLTGAQTFTGMATINGGALELAGSLPAPVTIGSGGRLQGTGNASGAVTVGGVIAPGSGAQGIDTLDVGSLAFLPGGVLESQVDPTDLTPDLLSVAGTVDVGSGVLRIDPLPGDYTLPVTRQILAAGGAVTGDFPDPEPFLLLDVMLDQTGDQVTVTLQRNAANLGEVGTPNQNAVGGALELLGGDPAFAAVFENLNIVTAADGGAALDSIGGEPISAFTTARVAAGQQFQRLVHQRLRGALFTRQPSPLLGSPSRDGDPPPWRPGARSMTDVAAAPDERLGLWFDGNGLVGSVEGDGNSADADYWLGAATLGADAALGSRGRIGLAVGYAHPNAELDQPHGSVDANTAQVALYAGYATPRVHAGVSGSYAWSRADSERDVKVGDLRYRADGEFDSNDFGARAELGLEAFPNGRYSLQPLAAFSWGHYERDSFGESGAEELSLDVDQEQIDTATLQLGARGATFFAIDEDVTLAPELRAFWIHEFGDLDRRVDASLGGVPFTVQGAESERDGVLIGAGWAVSTGPNVRATFAYDARFDANLLEHQASVAIRVTF